jgi:predicted DCC family thiol-disulfide oxidoreductase YuxK
VNTEITDKEKVNGWVLYDADCPFCIRIADRLRPPLARRHLALLPLQTPWVRDALGLTEAELLSEMRLLNRQGEVFGGADAMLEISRQFWWTWPLRQVSRVPQVRHLLHRAYQWVARNRHCLSGTCQIKTDTGDMAVRRSAAVSKTSRSIFDRQQFFDFLPLLLLPSLTATLHPFIAPWIFMWAMAFAIYFGCKWLTYRIAIRTATCNGAHPAVWRHVGYLFAWPGMDAKEFFNVEIVEKAPEDWRTPKAGAKRYDPGDRNSVLDCASPLALSPARKFIEHLEAARPRDSIRTDWLFATAKTLFGATLLWGGARMALPQSPLLAGWLGMIGVIFLIHFGAFHLLQLAWQAAGVNATPVMNNPLRATSLADFWGARWNTAFNELAFRLAFRPLRRWTTPATATLTVFVLSGLIHDLLISLPARGGYGLPTLYFLAQGAGILIERSRLGKKVGFGHGARGWFFTLLITAGPAFWLFHPPFIHHVILPMLTAIGATQK